MTDCEGRGEKPCPTCNAGQEHGFYKANQMTRCGACHGRGLLAHQDGSDTVLVVLLPLLQIWFCDGSILAGRVVWIVGTKVEGRGMERQRRPVVARIQGETGDLGQMQGATMTLG